MSKTQIQTIDTKFRNFAARFRYPVIALALTNICPLRAPAQDGHSHTMTSQHDELTPERKASANALVNIVRDSTERFKNVAAAVAEGYTLQFGSTRCMAGPGKTTPTARS
jgi:hypothetical protein